MNKVYDWFEERLEVQAIADDISSKYVPPHVNIFYCFGGLVLTCFLIQVATGFAMTFYYRPSVVDAFASVEYIMTSVNFGWLIRSIHRWSASMMVLMLVFGSYMFFDSVLSINLAADSYGGGDSASTMVRYSMSGYSPINSLMIAVSLLIGMGVSTRVSINLGAKRKDRALNTIKTGNMVGLTVAIIMTPILIFVSKP